VEKLTSCWTCHWEPADSSSLENKGSTQSCRWWNSVGACKTGCFCRAL